MEENLDMFFLEHKQPQLSSERFSVVYKLSGDENEAYAKAQDICLEQTVEFPGELVPEGVIRDSIVGKIESFEKYSNSLHYRAVISYAIESSSSELTQLLNVVFGNSSIKPGIRVEKLELSDSILKNFKGPRFGRNGIRELLAVKERPLLFTALKPMGLSSEDLSNLAYKFALGGIDIIKDDHGLSNQSFSPFEQRVELCVDAVNRANKESGRNSIYVPNITAPYNKILERARRAKELGAGGLLISPGLTGFDVMREISEDKSINLPIFSHPAFLGTYVMGEIGVSHGTLFGQIMRLAGADATIYPNFGGRFSFSREECENIAFCTLEKTGNLKPIFPCPAGGMSLSSIPESLKLYGNDIVFLVGSGLFKHGPDLVENCKYFRKLVENIDLKGIS